MSKPAILGLAQKRTTGCLACGRPPLKSLLRGPGYSIKGLFAARCNRLDSLLYRVRRQTENCWYYAVLRCLL